MCFPFFMATKKHGLYQLIMEAFDCPYATTILSKAHVKTHEHCLLACSIMKVSKFPLYKP